MSFYDNGSEYSWRPQPSSPTVDAVHNSIINNAASSSPSFNFNTNTGAESVVADSYGNTESLNEDFGNNTESGSFFNNNYNLDGGNNAINLNNPFSFGDNSVEEELQVVPESLDHLSRDELCRMIYRLDYERNTLQERLESLRNQFRTRQANYAPAQLTKTTYSPKKGAKRPRSSCNQQSSKRKAQTGAQSITIPELPPSQSDVESVKRRLGEDVFSAVRSSLHGGRSGRKVPKSTVALENVSLSMISAIMQDFEGRKVGDTRRQVRWTLTNDREIASILQSERLVHPVRHDGSDIILPAGSEAANVYRWARFLSMEVRYDRSSSCLTVVVKTTGAGSGRPENREELARYARGEGTFKDGRVCFD